MSLDLDKSSWKRVTLGEVAAASREKVDPTDGSVDRYVAGEHMDTDDLKIHRWGAVGEVDLGPAFHRRFRPGQVLYGSRRTYLRKVAVAEFDGVCANTTFVVETKDGNTLLQQLLPFIMSSEPFHTFAVGESKGSVNPYVNWSDMERYEFDLPSLPEQERIASLLWAAAYEQRETAALIEAAQDVRSRTRDELFASLSAGSVRFDSVCQIPSQNGLALKKSERAGTIPMVNMGEMFRGEVISPDLDYERVVVPSDNFLLAEGDLLFARRSIVFEGAGACCLVPALREAHSFESSILRTRVTSDVVSPHFVLHFFRSDRGRKAVSKIVRRGPVSGIAGSDLRKLRLPLPDLPVQRQIIESIERAGSPIPLLCERLEAAKTLQRTLVNAIFGGK